MYTSGLTMIFRTAWDLLNTTIIPAGAFTNSQDITFINILLLCGGGVVLAKFFRFCIGGNFNQFFDNDFSSSKRSKQDLRISRDVKRRLKHND